MDPERVERYLEKNVIEIAPIAFMRGRTLNDSFVILDEAQNTTSEQMKMFVTRLGFGSKAVITGDITQIDLPNARRSGLLEAIDILKDVNGLAFVHFDESDVVRHHLVQTDHPRLRRIQDAAVGTAIVTAGSEASAPRRPSAAQEHERYERQVAPLPRAPLVRQSRACAISSDAMRQGGSPRGPSF